MGAMLLCPPLASPLKSPLNRFLVVLAMIMTTYILERIGYFMQIRLQKSLNISFVFFWNQGAMQGISPEGKGFDTTSFPSSLQSGEISSF